MTKSADEHYLHLLAQKGKSFHKLKDIFQHLGGFYNGTGYAFPSTSNEEVEKIACELGVKLYQIPLEGQSFEEYKASEKAAYLKQQQISKGIELSTIQHSHGIDEMSEEAIINSDLPKDVKGHILSILKDQTKLEWNEKVDEILNASKQDIIYKNPSYKEVKPYTISDLENDLTNSKEGFKTGYDGLDEMTRIYSEAITLVGGRPSHGKTTLMMNFFINMIQLYPNLNFYFFSYEETQQQIALKIISILAEHVINDSHNLLQIAGYIKGKHSNITKINEAKMIYQDLVQSGRLKIVGEPFFVQDLSNMVKQLSSNEPLGVVFIDYMQKVKNKERFSTRQLELQKTSEIILETAKSASVPIVLGAQLGRDQNSKDKVRLDNLREAGDLEQDANVVLGIYNPSMEKAQSDQKPLTDRTVPITITPLKNRNGIVNKPVELIFDRPVLKISNNPRRR